jgi:hypothetical protein
MAGYSTAIHDGCTVTFALTNPQKRFTFSAKDNKISKFPQGVFTRKTF